MSGLLSVDILTTGHNYYIKVSLEIMHHTVGQIILLYINYTEQAAQLSQRDRAAGRVSHGQKWKTGTRRQYLRTIFNHCDVFGQRRNRNRNRRKKAT